MEIQKRKEAGFFSFRLFSCSVVSLSATNYTIWGAILYTRRRRTPTWRAPFCTVLFLTQRSLGFVLLLPWWYFLKEWKILIPVMPWKDSYCSFVQGFTKALFLSWEQHIRKVMFDLIRFRSRCLELQVCCNISRIFTFFTLALPWWLILGILFAWNVGRTAWLHRWRYMLCWLWFNQGIWSKVWNKSRTGVRNDPSVLTSKERIWLHRWMHGNWTCRDRHWDWHWKRVRRWTYNNWGINGRPWEHSSESLLILNIKVLSSRFEGCLLFSEIILLLS